MESNFSSNFWNKISDPTWYGLGEKAHLFMARDFNADQIIKSWFKVRSVPRPPKVETKEDKTTNSETAKEGENIEDIFEVEEDYDLNELLRDRLEDVYEEVAMKGEDNGQKTLKFIPMCSIVSIGNLLTTYERMSEEQKRQQPVDIKSLVRRNEILKVLMQLANDRLIVWPDIKDAIKLAQAANRREFELNMLTMGERWALYFYVLEMARKITAAKGAQIEQDLIAAKKCLQKVQAYGEGEVLRKARVVGVTTTGAAKYMLGRTC